MDRENIYQLLGISEQVPAEAVKKAFRKFARANHPDFFPGDEIREARFKKVTSAYQNWKLIQGTKGPGSGNDHVNPDSLLLTGQLYHIGRDPCEQDDLWDRHPEKVRELNRILEEIKRTDDSIILR